MMFFFLSRRRHTRWPRDWRSDVCSSDLNSGREQMIDLLAGRVQVAEARLRNSISAGIYSDGAGNNGKEITGLDAALKSTATGTYGGIDRSTWAFWNNQYENNGGTASDATNILNAMNRLALASARGT